MTRSEPLAGAQTPNGQAFPEVAAYSRLVQRLQRRYADWLPLLPPGEPTRQSLAEGLAALVAKGLDTGAALRVLRQLTLERLVQLDAAQQAPLQTITQGMTWLAEISLDAATRQVQADLDAVHGAPLAASGQRWPPRRRAPPRAAPPPGRPGTTR